MEGFTPRHPFLVCIDSDGCAFDVMEVKHKECFCPAFIEYFSLQPISRYARDAWDFVNLYSQTRGVHRLLALLRVLELLPKRREVRERGFAVPQLDGLRAYVAAGEPLSHDGMEAYLRKRPENQDVALALRWSVEVNRRIGQMVRGVPPFPHVREGLEAASAQADVVIVSATQGLALRREWEENGILPYVSLVCGQERGTKKQIIAALRDAYAENRVLMVGDAPGDRDAAHANAALFYPICPEREAASWAEFLPSLSAFLGGAYAGAKEKERIDAFDQLLPSLPPWETV